MSKKELAISIKNETETIKRIKEFLEETKIELYKVSLPDEVQVKLSKFLNQDVLLLVSPKKNKKYRVFDEKNEKFIDFGDIRFEDFTKHKDDKQRQRYLNRATNTKGNWKKNKFSPNNLAINGLWETETKV